jgi:eukaryotic-like serine/threonine-protein kinase
MTLTSGARLGPYQIASQIGVGGMGEVYRAIDTSLGRDVAVKVLPAAFASDADRVARFEREARTLASLNHPNIAAVYGLERSGSTLALVMELVSGPTLADCVTGPMPPDRAIAIARQVAYALEAAHDQGIVHRDLKPANIKVRADGTVKVLDFGLAKTTLDDPHADQLTTESPTIMSPALTQAGVILGTAAYMSPEQATARFVDKRSDIWAFGCVLYEMLTGHRPFDAPTVTETLAMILERDVDWRKLPAATPARVTTVLRRALEKDPKNRLHDIADARIELEDTRSVAPVASDRPSPTAKIWPLMLAALAGSIVAAIGVWWLKPSPSTASTRHDVTRLTVTPETPISPDGQGVIALSPDGRLLAYVAMSNGRPQLFLRRFDQFEGTPVPGTEGADNLAFSPDGNWIAFAADRKIKKVAVAGAPPLLVCEFAEGLGLTWESNNAILFNPGRSSGIMRVAASGGTPSPVTKLQAGETEHQSPDVLPGGKALLYNARLGGGTNNVQIFAESIETGQRHFVARGNGARYLETGHVLYVNGGSVFAVAFDPVRLELTGTPVVVQQGVRQTPAAIPQITFSRSGSMAYVPAIGGLSQDTIVWVDRQGVERATSVSDVGLSMPRLSPDLERVALMHGVGNGTQGSAGDLWAYDLARNTRSRLTFDDVSTFPLWSPEGTRLAYSSGASGRYLIHVKTIGGESDETLPSNEGTNYPLSWSPDGRYIAGVSVNPTTANDLWVYTLDPPTAKIFLQTRFREGSPVFSPDGHFIVYVSDQSGRNELYMRAFPTGGEEWTISTDGATEPRWAQRSGELFYRNGNAMMAVDIKTSPTVTIGAPHRLFERRYNPSVGYWPNYDVTPDGQRFLMIKGTGLEGPRQINVVLNWLDELNRLVPITGAK